MCWFILLSSIVKTATALTVLGKRKRGYWLILHLSSLLLIGGSRPSSDDSEFTNRVTRVEIPATTLQMFFPVVPYPAVLGAGSLVSNWLPVSFVTLDSLGSKRGRAETDHSICLYHMSIICTAQLPHPPYAVDGACASPYLFYLYLLMIHVWKYLKHKRPPHVGAARYCVCVQHIQEERT